MVQANLHKNYDFFTNMDPYCKILFLNQQFKTKTHNNGGKNPIWNQQFTFQVDNIDDICTIEIFDKDTFTQDDYIGKAVLNLSRALRNPVKDWYPVYKR